jgi:hypothetical protein
MDEVPAQLEDALSEATLLLQRGQVQDALAVIRSGIDHKTIGPDQAWAFLMSLEVLENAKTYEEALQAARVDWKAVWNQLVVTFAETLERRRTV